MTKITQKKIDNFRNDLVTTEPYSFRGILLDFFHNMTHVERKRFFYTMLDLFENPGYAIRKVLAGYRNYLYNPGEYVFVCGAIILVLTPRYKFFQNEFSQQIYDNEIMASHADFFKAFFNYAEEYATITNLLAIPIFALISWLVFFDNKKTYGENVVINAYITAQQLLLLILCIPFLELVPEFRHSIIAAYSVIVFIYNIWIYMPYSKATVYG